MPISSQKKQRSAKTKAILAGGVIAGLGITATLASWNTGALGEWLITGSDAQVLLEIQDADGNWVTGDDDGAALSLGTGTLSSFAESEGDVRSTDWFENRIRLSGVGAEEEFTLYTELSAITNTTAFEKVMMSSWIDMGTSAGTCAEVPTEDRHNLYGADGSVSAVSIPSLETLHDSSISVTGPLETRVCTHVFDATTNTEQIRFDHELNITAMFQAFRNDS